MKELQSGTESLEGTIKRITFQNEENGYTIATLAVEGRREPVPIIGTMPRVTPGDPVRVTGKWNRHEKFGLQLQVDSVERVMPVTADGILKFLRSGAVKGIGPATAKKLVGRFGLETLTVLERHPERLQELEGIGEKKAERMSRSFQEHRGVESVMVYLGVRGIAQGIAKKIYKRYGAEAIAVLEENPYRVVDEVPGIGFKTADQLAQGLGLPALSPHRIRVGLKHVLRTAADEGHVCLPQRELLSKASALLGSECDPHLQGVLQLLSQERTGGVILETKNESPTDTYTYLAGFYFAEVKAAERIRLMLTPLEDAPEHEGLVAEVEQENGLSLAPLQRSAVEAVLHKRLVVVTGGPGTGKTTTVKAMIAALEKQGITPVLAAPTGRAAKRMTESTGVTAKTLHRLLEYAQVEGEGLKFQRNEENRLEGKVFIVDEASMIDLLLFFQLLRALPDDARLVLCGDIDQLPSVGAGRVLQDIIESSVVEVVRLQTIFRQAKESLIVKNAHRINQGLLPEVAKDGDFFFLEEGNPDALTHLVLDLAARRLPAFLQGDPIEDIQILVPMRRGSLGVDSLNEQLQGTLNPPSPDKAELQQGARLFRVQDKVMQIKNNYQKEVFNGDVGRIRAIDPEEGEITVLYQDQEEPRHVTYAAGEIDELTLAYAVTVHKSQGSEYPCVILPVVMQHRVMLQRNLFYTGVTRAKKLVVVVGSKDALRVAVRHFESQIRHSRLGERIRSSAHPGGPSL